MKRESEKHKRMVESVRLREENEALKQKNEELKQQIQDLQRENKALKSINQSLDWQSDFDKLKVNYQWGKFIYYTEKLEELLLEMKSKISDEEEENEYKVFMERMKIKK